MMKISIIIPSYKPKDYIWECLNSLKNQTLNKRYFEIIIVLNGCKEPYFSSLLEYVSQNFQNFNVHLLQTDQGGVSNARNIALDHAKGEYITFIDDDDFISSTYLQSLYENLSESAISVSNVLAFKDGEIGYVNYYVSNVFQKIKNRKKVKLMSARSYMSIPVAKLIKRDYIQNRRFNEKFTVGEDALFMLSISDKIKYIIPSSEEAIYYRRFRENSAITKKKRKIEILKNKLKSAIAFTPYLLRPWRYNFLFCLSRFAALLK